MRPGDHIAPIRDEIDRLKAENERLRDRLVISPYGNDKIDELEEAIELLRHKVDTFRAENAAGERGRALVNALRGLLLSADCAWEERNEGHDWAEACQKARTVLQAYEGVPRK